MRSYLATLSFRMASVFPVPGRRTIFLRLSLAVAITYFGVSAGNAQPSNDECARAIPLPNVVNWCSPATAFTTSGATLSADTRGFCFPATGNGPDVWYSFTAQATTLQISVKGAGGATPGGTLQFPQLTVYSGACGALSAIQCVSDAVGSNYVETLVEKLQIGLTYYIRVSARNAKSGSFQLCLNNFNQVVNPLADCPTGKILCSKDPLTIDFVGGEGANPFEIANACERNSCKPKEYQSTWLKWTCGQAGTLSFSITPLHASDDIDFIVYELPRGVTDCGTLTPIRCMSSGENVGQPLSNWVSCTGSTGLRDSETDEAEYCGCSTGSNNFLAPLNMTPGKSYALVVVNYSRSGRGFNITFGGNGTFSGTFNGADPQASLSGKHTAQPTSFFPQSPSFNDDVVTLNYQIFNRGATAFALDSIAAFLTPSLSNRGLVDAQSEVNSLNTAVASPLGVSGNLSWVAGPARYPIGVKDTLNMVYRVRIPANVPLGVYSASIRGYIGACPTAPASTAVSIGITCPSLTGSITGPSGVCVGSGAHTFKVDGLVNMLNTVGPTIWDFGVRFVYFNSSTPVNVYSLTPDGLLGNAVLSADRSSATLENADLPDVPGTYYVYAILNPIPSQVSCRPFAGPFVLRVLNEPIVSVTGGGSICPGKSAILSAVVEGGAGNCGLEWQFWDTANNRWMPVEGGTREPTLTVSPKVTTSYRAVLRCDGDGCGVTYSNPQTVEVPGDIVLKLNAPASVCPGGSALLQAEAAGAAATCTYTWQRSSNASVWETLSGSNGPSLTVSPTANFHYRVLLTCGTCSWVSNSSLITIAAAPDVVLSGSTSICAGGTATLTATTSGGIGDCSLRWQSSPNGITWTTLQQGPDRSASFSPTQTTQYRVIYFCPTASNCKSDTSGSQTITVFPNAQISVSGGRAVCAGVPVQLTAAVANGTGSCAVRWQTLDSLSGSWTDLPGLVGTRVTVIPSKTTQYRARYDCNGTGCTPAFSNAETVTVLLPPAVSISGPAAVCIGGVDSLRALASGGSALCTLQWQRLVNNTWQNLNGQTARALPLANLDTTARFRVLYSCDAASCGQAVSNEFIVTVIKTQWVSLSGPDSICAGAPAVLRASGSTGDCSFQWTYFNARTRTWMDIPGATSPVLEAKPDTTTDYRVVYRCASAGCDIGISNIFRVRVFPQPIVSLRGASSICAGDSTTLEALVSGAGPSCGFTWQSSSDGLVWTSFAGTSSSRRVSPAQTTHYRVMYACPTRCGDTSDVLVVQVSPKASLQISASAPAVCTGSPVLLRAILQNAESTCRPQWQSSPNGATDWRDIPLASGDSLRVTPASAVFYRALLSCSVNTCSTGPSNVVLVQVFAPPSVTVTGGGAVCPGSSVVLSATPSGGIGTCSVLWEQSVDGGNAWSRLEGQVSSTITVSPVVPTQYRAVLSCSGGGNCAPVLSNSVSVSLLPTPSLRISGPSIVCEGSTLLLTSTLSNETSACSISWQQSPDGQNWQTINGLSGATVSLEPLANTRYRALLSCSGATCGASTSNVVSVTVVQGAEGKDDRKEVATCSAVGYDLQRNVNLFGNGRTSQFTWVALADNPQVSGESLRPVDGTVITDILTNLSPSPQTVVYRVTAGIGNCPGSIFRITVTILPKAGTSCVTCIPEVALDLGDSCSLRITPAMLMRTSSVNCQDSARFFEQLEVIVEDGGVDNRVEACGEFRFIVRVKPEYQLCSDFQGCKGILRVRDVHGPRLAKRLRSCGREVAGSAPWQDTILCAHLERVLNNPLSWTTPAFDYYTGTAVFEDACKEGCQCSTTLSVRDQLILSDCQGISRDKVWAKIVRTFTGTDCVGNMTQTEQTIFFVRPALDPDLYSRQGIREIVLDNKVCAAPTTEDMIRRFKERYYVVPDPYACAQSTAKTAFFPEAVAAGNASSLTQCGYNFRVDILNELALCQGGKRVEIVVRASDECTSLPIAMDTFHLISRDEVPPTITAAFRTVVISNGVESCESSFGVDVPGLERFFGIRVRDNCSLNPSLAITIQYFGPDYVDGKPVGPSEWRTASYPRILVKGLDGKDYLTATRVRTGRHRLLIEASDDCQNKAALEFEFTVADQFAPVVKCPTLLSVALNGTVGISGGYAKVMVKDIDRGSTDNCGLNWVRVRRTYNPKSIKDFIQRGYDSNNDKTINQFDGIDWNKDGDISDFGERFTFDSQTNRLMPPLLDYVEFFCADAGDSLQVQLFVEDVSGNQSNCSTPVKVEYKGELAWTLPKPITVSCREDSLLSALTRQGAYLPGSVEYNRIVTALRGDMRIVAGLDCGEATVRMLVDDELTCNAGHVDISWTITRLAGGVSVSRTTEAVRITVQPERNYALFFPADTAVAQCGQMPSSNLRREVQGCDVLGVFVQDKATLQSGSACLVVKRTYTVVNWCNYVDACGDPVQWAVLVPKDPRMDGPDGVGVFVKDQDPTDGLEEIYFDDNGNGLPDEAEKVSSLRYNNPANTPCASGIKGQIAWMFTQDIAIPDTVKPTISFAQKLPDIPNTRQCTKAVELNIVVQDDCSMLPDTGIVLGKKGVLALDSILIWPDTQSYPGGVRPLGKFVPDAKVAYLGNNNWSVKGEFPEGLHRLLVRATDPCGNQSPVTTIPVSVLDNTIPMPQCKPFVSIDAQMVDLDNNGVPEKAAALFLASDFIENPIFDCNGQGKADSNGLRQILTYSIHLADKTPDPNSSSLWIDCVDAWKFIPVEIYAWDQRGNKRACLSFAQPTDEAEVCRSYRGFVAGEIRTVDSLKVESVEVSLKGPALEFKLMTKQDGLFRFGNVNLKNPFALTPYKNDDFGNGLTTADLIAMQQHILGEKFLPNPYRLIAADVNNTGSITVLDLIQLRRVVLKLENTFPNNRSWRFIPTGYVFSNPKNPWLSAYPESLNIPARLDSMAGADFIGIKIGDLNGDVIANSRLIRSRSASSLFEIRVKEQNARPGEIIRVPLRSDAWKQLAGCQFGLSYDREALALVQVEPGLAKPGEWAHFEEEGLLALSWVRSPDSPGDKQDLLTLVFQVMKPLSIADRIQLNSRILRPEGYDANGKVADLKITFEGASPPSARPELYQNFPNPFGEETHISFWLPVAQRAEITVTDIKGSRVYQSEKLYEAGVHEITLRKSALSASGVLFYTLKTEGWTATKKMLLIE